jgi:RNA polymerase sigma-70 factor (ECF subfamily)
VSPTAESVKAATEDSPHQSDAAASGADVIARLFSEHNRALVGYLTSRLRSEAEAKEVAQEAYVRMLQLDKPGAVSLLRAYLFKTAANLAVDRLRRRSTLEQIERDDLFVEFNTPDSEAFNPERHLLDEETRQELHRCLSELPEKCQQAFRWHRLEGLSQQEVARRVGCSERMIRRYINYALVYCRQRIDGATAEQARERLVL